MKDTINNSSSANAVLFDLDGTLLDSWPDIQHVLICTIKKFYPDMTTDHIDAIKYLNLTDPESIIKKALNLDSNEVLPKDISEFGRILYPYIMGSYEKPYEGVEEIIDFLNSNNTPWGIVTNRQKYFAKLSISKFNIFNTIKCLVCRDDVLKPKPEPDALLLAAKLLNISVGKCFFIGDSLTDIISGRKAGMRTIAVKYGYGFDQINSAVTDINFIVYDTSELKNLLSLLLN